MKKILDQLVPGLIAAVVTGVIAAVVIWKITAGQQEFVAQQFAAQGKQIQAVATELGKTTSDLKRLDGALKTTEATLRDVKGQVSLVGTRNGLAQISGMIKDANKALADIKQATTPEQTKAALAPLADKLDMLSKAVAVLPSKPDDKMRDQARDEALARIQTAIAGVKDAIAKRPTDPALTQANAKLNDALKDLAALGKTADGFKTGVDANAAKLADTSKSLNALGQALDAIKSDVSANAAKLDQASSSLTALNTAVKQGFANTTAKRADLVKAAIKPVSAQQAEPEQDLVVFYVSMAGAAPAPKPAVAAGLTPAVPPPLAVHYEKIGGINDDGQAKVIANRLRAIMKGHSGCTVAVAGHADTLGSDRANYELSKQRATAVADKLKAAFAGESVKITQTQWGERRLTEWTPDGTANEANRRVDIKVSCGK